MAPPFLQLRYSFNLLSFFVLVALPNFASAQNVTTTTLRLSGESAGDGIQFARFQLAGSPVSNNRGEYVFSADLEGENVTPENNIGVFIDVAGDLQLVARKGDLIPDSTSGIRFDSFRTASFNTNGEFVFRAELAGGAITDTSLGLFSNAGGELQSILYPTQPAPNFEQGVTFAALFDRSINDAGEIIFRADVVGPGIDDSNNNIISARLPNGQITQLLREGQSFEQLGGGVVLRTIINRQPNIDSAGRFGLRVILDGPSINESNDTALISRTSGDQFQVIAHEGQSVPVIQGDVNYGVLSGHRRNRSGQMVFESNLTGSDVDATNGDAIFIEDNGSLTIAVRSGQAAPATGTVFGRLGEAYINELGDLMFNTDLAGASVTDADDTAVFTKTGSTLHLILREGQSVSGLPNNVEIDDLSFAFPPFAGFTFNNSGQVGIRALLRGDGVTEDNDLALFFYDGVSLNLVAHKGGVLDVDQRSDFEDLRTVSEIGAVFGSAGEGRNMSALNNRGELLFRLEFTDGTSGIFVASSGTERTSGLLGDVNTDGAVDFGDIAPFIAVLSSGRFQFEADTDGNTVVNFSDIPPFISILISGP